MLITIEGLDGMGKSTLINTIRAQLDEQIYIISKEPGALEVPGNKAIRTIVKENTDISPFSRELLFYADALNHREFIEDHLAANKHIISDRGLWSHLAYLYGYMKLGLLGPDADANYTRYGMCRHLIKECCAAPQAIIYLQGDHALMQERVTLNRDAIEALGVEFYAYVLASYDDLLLAAKIEEKPTLVLNAKNSLAHNSVQVMSFIRDICK